MTSREHALAPRADKALRQVQGHRLQFSSLVLLLSRRLSFTDHLTSTKRHETSIPIHSARCKGGRFHFPSSASGLGQKRRKNIRNGPFGAGSQLDSLSLPVSQRNTSLTPVGCTSFQPRPAIRKLPPSLPEVRQPM